MTKRNLYKMLSLNFQQKYKDKIFNVDSNTEEVYNSFIRHIICSTMDGFNGTLIFFLFFFFFFFFLFFFFL